ncbi:hypothetical protein QQS21_009503 [Conoideocrella luteorostrata]|uniref:FAD-binding PCMH-type domain-containing protein n=1 Tax=Conoideocrella luteorostrata TaxID=1105319 RepID=A0AAJ0FV01_9HYPO|nr:hypothetical protein QQS21_009503 [Conoideocrella luteorostrata]
MPSCPQADCLVASGLGSQVVLPDDPKYLARVESYFDNGAKLHPACFVQPQTAVEVATAVRALAKDGQEFAVRAGGCINRVGSNNISGGVTIDLILLNGVEYNPQTHKADVGPGATWKEVYDELEGRGRVVGGGRVGSVGVGGFLLGGGISFHSGRCGFACDTVVAYEVVLADGTTITATSEQHKDLFRALKGGGNNFGIVTRFTMETYPAPDTVWGGVSLKPIDTLHVASQALQDFTSNVSSDLDSTMIFVAAHQPEYGGNTVLTLCFNAAGVEKPQAFKKFLDLPETFSKYQIGKVQDLLPLSELPLNNVWYSLAVKNDAAIISKASELIYKLANDLKANIADGEFTTHCAFQPIPRVYTERSLAAGGNVMGLDNYPHDTITLQVSASVKTAELAEWVRPQVEAVVEEVRAFAGEDRLCPWLYLNYAHSSQKVLESYGRENVDLIKAVAAKYDPDGVFQRLCPGGFKISAVKA